MIVTGLDLSITATGVAVDGMTWTIRPTEKGDKRLSEIREGIRRALACQFVAIEDLPTHAKAAGITGMVHGVVRAYLCDWRTPYALITPASVKKYATGKGNADKTAMALAAFKRAGVEFGDDNQCDAWWLRAMALDYYGSPVVEVPQSHRVALDGVTWPEVRL